MWEVLTSLLGGRRACESHLDLTSPSGNCLLPIPVTVSPGLPSHRLQPFAASALLPDTCQRCPTPRPQATTFRAQSYITHCVITRFPFWSPCPTLCWPLGSRCIAFLPTPTHLPAAHLILLLNVSVHESTILASFNSSQFLSQTQSLLDNVSLFFFILSATALLMPSLGQFYKPSQ